MPFGLYNTSVLFQDYIDWALEGMEDKLIVYLDDILIHGLILEKLCDQMKWYLQQLQENKLFAKLKKCEFEVIETRILGFIVNEKGLTMEPEHIKTITNWPVPTILIQV